jgi:hypothetical protein
MDLIPNSQSEESILVCVFRAGVFGLGRFAYSIGQRKCLFRGGKENCVVNFTGE